MIVLESKSLELLVLPEVGGKIGQIRDKQTGYPFLIPPQRPYETIARWESWLDHDTSGMDDCFPNIAAGAYPFAPWTGTAVPDLGEWTHEQWRLNTVTNSEIVLERSGEWLPYNAWKKVVFEGDRAFRVSYRLVNTGTVPFRYIWSAHPLIAVPGEYQLSLPGTKLTFRSFPFDGNEYAWPRHGPNDLSTRWIDEKTTLKVFVTGLNEGWCELKQPRYTIRFTYDVGRVPVLGLWFNNSGFPAGSTAPFRCIAVEPCTSASDLLDELPPDAYPMIGPGQVQEWSLGLEILPVGRR